MPLFLWGFVLAGGEEAVHLMDARFWLVFFVVHILFYGGSTALNSYYDRDEGPVGGLWNPPKVTRQLWTFAVGVQVLAPALGDGVMFRTAAELERRVRR